MQLSRLRSRFPFMPRANEKPVSGLNFLNFVGADQHERPEVERRSGLNFLNFVGFA